DGRCLSDEFVSRKRTRVSRSLFSNDEGGIRPRSVRSVRRELLRRQRAQRRVFPAEGKLRLHFLPQLADLLRPHHAKTGRDEDRKAFASRRPFVCWPGRTTSSRRTPLCFCKYEQVFCFFQARAARAACHCAPFASGQAAKTAGRATSWKHQWKRP